MRLVTSKYPLGPSEYQNTSDPVKQRTTQSKRVIKSSANRTYLQIVPRSKINLLILPFSQATACRIRLRYSFHQQVYYRRILDIFQWKIQKPSHQFQDTFLYNLTRMDTTRECIPDPVRISAGRIPRKTK